jgi:hypothetical protein
LEPFGPMHEKERPVWWTVLKGVLHEWLFLGSEAEDEGGDLEAREERLRDNSGIGSRRERI